MEPTLTTCYFSSLTSFHYVYLSYSKLLYILQFAVAYVSIGTVMADAFVEV